MPEKLHELEQIRLRRDWSYRDLAEHIFRATGIRRNQDCWRKICQGLTPNPHASTSFAMAGFYAAVGSSNGHARKRRAS